MDEIGAKFNLAEFDIAEWQRLAQADPVEFERRRQAAIEAVIAQAPSEQQARMRGLQFRIDLERTRAKTPLGAALRLQSMMWERFSELRKALLALAGPDLPAKKQDSRSATVLPFVKR